MILARRVGVALEYTRYSTSQIAIDFSNSSTDNGLVF